MPTFKPVVSAHQKRSDGSYNIKIRITHKRVSRWIPTNLNAYAYDLTRSLNLKMADIYIEKDYTIMNDANRIVMALFDWPMME